MISITLSFHHISGTSVNQDTKGQQGKHLGEGQLNFERNSKYLDTGNDLRSKEKGTVEP